MTQLSQALQKVSVAIATLATAIEEQRPKETTGKRARLTIEMRFQEEHEPPSPRWLPTAVLWIYREGDSPKELELAQLNVIFDCIEDYNELETFIKDWQEVAIVLGVPIVTSKRIGEHRRDGEAARKEQP